MAPKPLDMEAFFLDDRQFPMFSTERDNKCVFVFDSKTHGLYSSSRDLKTWQLKAEAVASLMQIAPPICWGKKAVIPTFLTLITNSLCYEEVKEYYNTGNIVIIVVLICFAFLLVWELEFRQFFHFEELLLWKNNLLAVWWKG